MDKHIPFSCMMVIDRMCTGASSEWVGMNYYNSVFNMMSMGKQSNASVVSKKKEKQKVSDSLLE